MKTYPTHPHSQTAKAVMVHLNNSIQGLSHAEAQPIQKNENILNKEVLPLMFINAILMAVLSLAAFYFYMDTSIGKGRTGVFIIMAFTQIFNVFNLRNIRKSVFEIGLYSNRYINLAIGISVILLILVTEVTFLAAIFNFKSLFITDLIVLFYFPLWCFGEVNGTNY